MVLSITAVNDSQNPWCHSLCHSNLNRWSFNLPLALQLHQLQVC